MGAGLNGIIFDNLDDPNSGFKVNVYLQVECLEKRVGIKIVRIKLLISKFSIYCEVPLCPADFTRSIFISPAIIHGND